MTDQINIEILEDGTIKMSTDKIGQANHLSAEKFLEHVARLTDGNVKREKKTQSGHVHHHHHAGH